jgi:hypothetical protein
MWNTRLLPSFQNRASYGKQVTETEISSSLAELAEYRPDASCSLPIHQGERQNMSCIEATCMSKHILNSSILDQQTIITLLLLLILLAPSCSWMPLLKTGPHEEPHSTYAALQDRCQAPAALASSRSVSFSLSLSWHACASLPNRWFGGGDHATYGRRT